LIVASEDLPVVGAADVGSRAVVGDLVSLEDERRVADVDPIAVM
jgi:hypothetical protein